MRGTRKVWTKAASSVKMMVLVMACILDSRTALKMVSEKDSLEKSWMV